MFDKWFKKKSKQGKSERGQKRLEKRKEVSQMTDDELKKFIAETGESMNEQMSERLKKHEDFLDPVMIEIIDKVMSAIEEAQKRSLQILLNKYIFSSILSMFGSLLVRQCFESRVGDFDKCPICSSRSELRRYRIDQALQVQLRLLRTLPEVLPERGIPVHYYDIMMKRLVDESLDDLVARLREVGETVGFDRDFLPPGSIFAVVCPKCKIAAFPLTSTTISLEMKEGKLYARRYLLNLLNPSAYALHYIVRYKLQWTKEGFEELENWKRV